SVQFVYAQHPAFDNNPYFGRNDSSKYMPSKKTHGGAGTVNFMQTTPRKGFESNFIFLHRGQIMPKSGIGEHAHRNMEEMFFCLDKYAEFTVNGETAAVPGPGMVLCPKGSSHGIYNPSDQPVEWMNLAVSYDNRQYDAVNFNTKGGDLVNQEIESPPPFKWGHLSKEMLAPVENYCGGKGTVYFRDVWTSDDFKTNWEYLRHYLIPAGSSIGLHRHDNMEVVYYIHSGKGRGTVNDATYDVINGDSISCVLHSSIGVYNNSNEDMEILAIGVSMVKGETDSIPVGDDLSAR
ncbi:cupin domain-containing protein, partial [Candidatus Latescibacterota bacterium]